MKSLFTFDVQFNGTKEKVNVYAGTYSDAVDILCEFTNNRLDSYTMAQTSTAHESTGVEIEDFKQNYSDLKRRQAELRRELNEVSATIDTFNYCAHKWQINKPFLVGDWLVSENGIEFIDEKF